MRHPRRIVFLGLFAALAGASLASASGFGLFQHGARAIGQAGAFTARASDPSAVTYNPAAITQSSGLQVEAGLDMNNPTITYTSATSGNTARTSSNFHPPSTSPGSRKATPLRWVSGTIPPSTTASGGTRHCFLAAS